MNIEFDDSLIFKKKAKVIERFGDELLLFESSQGVLFEANETAKAIWILIDGKNTVRNIKDRLREEFDEVEKIDEDLKDFLNDLLKLDMIEKQEEKLNP